MFVIVGMLIIDLCLVVILPVFFGLLVITVGLRDFQTRIRLRPLLQSALRYLSRR